MMQWLCVDNLSTKYLFKITRFQIPIRREESGFDPMFKCNSSSKSPKSYTLNLVNSTDRQAMQMRTKLGDSHSAITLSHTAHIKPSSEFRQTVRNPMRRNQPIVNASIRPTQRRSQRSQRRMSLSMKRKEKAVRKRPSLILQPNPLTPSPNAQKPPPSPPPTPVPSQPSPLPSPPPPQSPPRSG